MTTKEQILPKGAHNRVQGVSLSSAGLRIAKDLVGEMKYARVFTLRDSNQMEIQLHRNQQSDLFKLEEQPHSFAVYSRAMYRNLKLILPDTTPGPKTYKEFYRDKDQVDYIIDL